MMDRMKNTSNRSLPDESMDDMFHALGRPADIHFECFRNYFCTEAFSEKAQFFTDSENWDFVKTINEYQDSIFSVSDIGLQDLGKYIDDLDMVNDAPEGTA